MSAGYSDISDILARKGEGRRALQTLSMAEKILAMEALRERLAPFKAARQNRTGVTSAAMPNASRP